MDERKDLKNCLTELNKGLPNCKMEGSELKVKLLQPEMLTNKQKAQLEDNKGTMEDINKVNSSAALVVNYYQMYEQFHKDLRRGIKYERDLTLPLKKVVENKKWVSRFDVSYQKGTDIHFVEGKFLEPYYHDSHKRRIKDEFLTSEYYLPEMENVEKWLRFAEKWEEFKHFDFPQMYKHLLAIHYHRMLKPNVYAGKTVRLQSVSWLMTDKFLSHYKEMKGVRLSYKRLKKLCDDAVKEEDRAQKEFNDFIQAIGMKDFVFEIKHYNDPDMLKEIARSDKFEAFKKQYLLDYFNSSIS